MSDQDEEIFLLSLSLSLYSPSDLSSLFGPLGPRAPRERLKGEKGGDGIKRRKKKEEERRREKDEARGRLVKNGQPAREDSLGLRRALRPCSGRDFTVRSFVRLKDI